MTDEHEEGLAGDKQEMERIRKKIDVTDSYCIQQYGAGLELRMAELSGQIMTRVRAFEENDTQTLIRQLLDKLEDPEDTEPYDTGESKGFWEKLSGYVSKRGRRSYEKIRAEVDEIAGQLDKSRMELLKELTLLDKLYEKNMEYYHRLELYIKAGEEELEHVKVFRHPEISEQAKGSGDAMDQEIVQNDKNMMEQFERRLYQLKLARTMAMQAGPQIRLLENNCRITADKIQEILTVTIPVWKQRMPEK